MMPTRALRSAVERTPLIQFIGKRTMPATVDHTPRAHPAAPTSTLPSSFTSSSSSSSSSGNSSGNTSTTFSAYRQSAQQHGPLGRSAFTSGIGGMSGQSLGSVKPARKGEAFDRNELPERFRRGRIDVGEMEAIETGGATMVC